LIDENDVYTSIDCLIVVDWAKKP